MENFETPKSKVYIKIDENNRVLACEGGYTMDNISNIEDDGDKYNLCQAHYFDGGLYTEDYIPRYKYEDGVTMLRSEEEIEADKPEEPEPEPTPIEENVWGELDKAYQEGVNSI